LPERDPKPENPDDQAEDGQAAAGRHSESPTEEQIAAQICREVTAILQEAYGRAANRVTAYLVEDFVLVLVDGLQLLPSEELLVEKGHADSVVGIRDRFERAIRPSFAAIVERATGRRVVRFTSHTEVVEEHFAIQLFRLRANEAAAVDELD